MTTYAWIGSNDIGHDSYIVSEKAKAFIFVILGYLPVTSMRFRESTQEYAEIFVQLLTI